MGVLVSCVWICINDKPECIGFIQPTKKCHLANKGGENQQKWKDWVWSAGMISLSQDMAGVQTTQVTNMAGLPNLDPKWSCAQFGKQWRGSQGIWNPRPRDSQIGEQGIYPEGKWIPFLIDPSRTGVHKETDFARSTQGFSGCLAMATIPAIAEPKFLKDGKPWK